MQSVSEAFKVGIKEDGRIIEAKAVIAGITYEKNAIISFEISEDLVDGNDLTFGCCVSNSLTLKVKSDDSFFPRTQVKVYVRLVALPLEWYQLGSFYIDKVKVSNGIATIEALDDLIYSDVAYISTLSFPATFQDVLQDIMYQLGLTAEALPSGSYSVPSYNNLKPLTCRQMLSYIAGVYGGNATMTRVGTFAVRQLGITSIDVIGRNSYFGTLKLSGDIRHIGKIVGDNGSTVYAAGSGTDYETIRFENPYITQAAVNAIQARLSSYSYIPYEQTRYRCFSYLEAGDMITIEYQAKQGAPIQNLATTILNNRITYSGALSGYIKASSKTEQEIVNGFEGTLEKAIKDIDTSGSPGEVTTEQIKNVIENPSLGISIPSANVGVLSQSNLGVNSVGTVQINDAAITTAKIGLAQITDALIASAAISTAHIRDLSVTNAKIVDASIDSAKIANAAITFAHIANATIKTANIETGAITTALIATGAISTAQIADASITDAKIVELTANKITAGLLSVDRLEIRGTTTSLVYAINNISGALQAQSVDTLNGEILTPRTITADRIVAGAITANELAAKTITADKIAVGTITGASGIIANLDASVITTGSLNASIINTGTLTGVNIDVVNDIRVGDQIIIGATGAASTYSNKVIIQNINGVGYLKGASETTALKFWSGLSGAGSVWCANDLVIKNGSIIGVHSNILGTSYTEIMELSTTALKIRPKAECGGGIYISYSMDVEADANFNRIISAKQTPVGLQTTYDLKVGRDLLFGATSGIIKLNGSNKISLTSALVSITGDLHSSGNISLSGNIEKGTGSTIFEIATSSTISHQDFDMRGHQYWYASKTIYLRTSTTSYSALITTPSNITAAGYLSVKGGVEILGNLKHSNTSLGFFGATPISKPSVASTALAMTASATTPSTYNSSWCGQLRTDTNNILTRLNLIQTALRNLGLM